MSEPVKVHGELRAYEGKDGRITWRDPGGKIVEPPITSDDVPVISDLEANLERLEFQYLWATRGDQVAKREYPGLDALWPPRRDLDKLEQELEVMREKVRLAKLQQYDVSQGAETDVAEWWRQQQAERARKVELIARANKRIDDLLRQAKSEWEYSIKLQKSAKAWQDEVASRAQEYDLPPMGRFRFSSPNGEASRLPEVDDLPEIVAGSLRRMGYQVLSSPGQHQTYSRVEGA